MGIPRSLPLEAILLVLVLVSPERVALADGTARASVHTDGTQGELGNSNLAAVGGAGRFVAFESGAWTLVDGDGNGTTDVFLRDTAAPSTERISVSSTGIEGNGESTHPSVSEDGRFVAFVSSARNLVIPPTAFSRSHVYLRDRQAGTTTLVSATLAGTEGSASSDFPSLSADGRYVAFTSLAADLVDPPTNGYQHVFRYDRITGEIRLVSRHDDGTEAGQACYHPSISGDGNLVVFHTHASLEWRDQTSNRDVYVRDIAAAHTALVSVASNGVEAGSLHSQNPVISADGSRVAFESTADNLVPGVGGMPHIYVRSLGGASTSLASVSDNGTPGNGASYFPSINANGSSVAFQSDATNFVPDGNGWADVFVHRAGVPIERASVPDDALGDPEGNGWSWNPAIGSDGGTVAFESWSTDLVADDTNGFADIFVRELDAPALTATWPGAGSTPSLLVWPNPTTATSGADVRFEMPAPGRVRLFVYDVAGRRILALADVAHDAGTHAVHWSGRDERGARVAAGVYHLAFVTDGRRGAGVKVIVR